MKKTLFAVLALAAVAACNKAEVVEQSAANAIAFDNAFVDNAVKSVSDPSFTNEKLFSDFAVFGFVEGATLFDGTQVKKEKINNDLKSDWQYTGTQYWIAGAQYKFNAVAPKTSGNWTKTTATPEATTLAFTNNGTTDLLYATTAQQGKVSDNAKVAFTFRHVLSKVKFSFENAYNATNATIRVKEIFITNPHKTANVVLTDATAWDTQATADGFTLAFGMATDDESTTDAKENVEVAYGYGKVYESQNELFLIPSTSYDYDVTFTVELLVSNQVVATYNHEVTATFAPAPGTCYDIKAVINAQNIDPNHAQEPIEFTVAELPGWGTASDVNATVNNNKN